MSTLSKIGGAFYLQFAWHQLPTQKQALLIPAILQSQREFLIIPSYSQTQISVGPPNIVALQAKQQFDTSAKLYEPMKKSMRPKCSGVEICISLLIIIVFYSSVEQHRISTFAFIEHLDLLE